MAELSLAKAKEQFELSRPSFAQMNLNKLSFEREVMFAIQSFEKNPFLLKCSGIGDVLNNIVLSGLSLNPVLKYIYLVPRKIKKEFVVCADPSYMGLCKILTDTGSVVGISATIVYEKEAHTLDIKEGMGGHAKHKAYIGFDKPGKPIACYSIAVLPNGMQHVELLRPWEWEGIRKRSESVKSYETKKAAGEYAPIPTWDTDPEEMIRKTCIKKHYKYLPKTERATLAATAIDLDHQANGIDFEQEAADKAQQQKQEGQTAGTTPDAPFEDAYATDEDFATMFELLANENLGTVFITKGCGLISNWKTNLEKRKNDKTLLKDKAEEYIKFFNWEITEAKKANDLESQQAKGEAKDA